MSRHVLQRLRDMLVLSSRATLRDSSASAVHALTCRQASQYHCSSSLSSSDTSGEETISATFHDEKDGSTKTVQVPVGQSLMEAAHANDIDLEGACEGSLACSTCHVVIEDPALYEKLEEPTDDENDMLDLAYGLTETSRLGCQVIAAPELDGIKVRIPGATRNFAVDGYKPKPH
ncbi:Adrenodoxin-like protein 1, mitochondrial [Coccomyxa viridis]|uniref:2Fe-2S ferredoxin n=1 Tax=Coccomyxa viridis TaxID=1274662 RepID=A0AAV1HWY0_9CHLO|nr:Adrenodoxin-like protein 1, mitochondrial [Coccomyxa viridis]